MPRPERPLDPLAGPVQAFAADLRKVRENAGNPKYLQMSRVTGRSRTALAEAAGGDRLATWETVEAYLIACGQGPSGWLERWEAVRAAIQYASGQSTARVPSAPEPPRSGGGRVARRKRLLLVTAAVALAAVATALGGTLSLAGSGGGLPVLVVQNKVTAGATGFYEDNTPEYLSALLEPECAEHGCEVPNTQMWSGDLLEPLCQARGALITNEDSGSAGIQNNPHGQTSTLWFRAKTSTGVVGYIPQAYLTPASADGLGLPQCPPS
jgi:hypothetical protein